MKETKTRPQNGLTLKNWLWPLKSSNLGVNYHLNPVILQAQNRNLTLQIPVCHVSCMKSKT